MLTAGFSALDFLADAPVVNEPPELQPDLTAPFPYFGGKRRAAALIWERFGDVVNYVEPFAGSLAVLLARPADHRARVETVNDIDGLVVNLWRAVQADPEAVARGCDWPVMKLDLHARHRALIASRAEVAKKLEADPRWYDVELAAWWAWGASCWIGAGWCADSEAANRKRPAIGGDGGPRNGGGVHGHAQREPSLRGANGEGWKRPDLAGGNGSGPAAKLSKGVHAEPMREPTKKLPILIGGHGDVNSPQLGKGVHAGDMRAPSWKLPDIGGQNAGGHGRASRRGVHAGAMHRRMPDVGAGRNWDGESAQARDGKGVHGASVRTALYDTFTQLAARLRYVRVTCGDWSRICTPAVTWKHGVTGVLLDPPYGDVGRTSQIYARDSLTVSADVRAWALEAGRRPDMRIALCGYEGEHEELDAAGWSVVAWKAHGGYGVQGDGAGRENAARERIWFSPACLRPQEAAGPLFERLAAGAPEVRHG